MKSQALSRKVLALLAYAVLLVPTLAFADQGSAQAQVKTAVEHATFASKAGDVSQTHLHLHHVINCLVGPYDSSFDAKAGNPCDGQGKGALNDLSGSTQERDTLLQALALAKVGVTIPEFKPANYTALAVKALLEEAEQGK